MTSCGEIRLLLGPFEDGELEPHEMEDVAFHVVGCAACKRELEEYRALGVALRDISNVPSLDNFARAVTARLVPQRIPLGVRFAEWWDSLGRIAAVIEFAGVAAAAAMVTLLVAGPDVRIMVSRRLAPFAPVIVQAPASIRPGAALARAGGDVGLPRAAGLVSTGNQAAGSRANPAGVEDHPAGPDNLAGIIDPGKRRAAGDVQEMLSDLGAGQSPAVAVWNEPHTDTTAVWIPDHP